MAAIAPLVAKSQHRLDGIPESAWLDPYVVGFMMMLITLTARREVNISDSQTLGAVQTEAWADITRLRLSTIGEETLHLSAMEHKMFEAGCRNAIAFDLALYGTSIAGVSDGGSGRIDDLDFHPADERHPAYEREHITALWQDYFEGHIHL